ncbi:MAG: phosphate acetyltransferase [Gammaproteobacteria bacterium]|nr:phosphate acetyltransferase [Gammaproteobacteria bacterium]MYD75685.1 phosphate acetyltransferase [Gammaproteobacteria bacterium]MYJ51536.1 phosphate acetyltransferase [Gammaproteobacteria bacterium]
MSLFETIFERARAAQSTIVLPEGGDPRVTAAAERALEMGLARIVLLCGESDPGLGTHDALTVVNPETDERIGRYADALYELRQHKGLTRDQAQEAVKDTLVFSAMMTRLGEADGYVAGAVHTTASVLRAALQVVGVAKGARQVSSFFIMEHRMAHQAVQGVALYADCAMVIDPGPEELADIAMATARHARSLLAIEPVVALLSFSTAGSAVHPYVDKVRQAGELVAAAMPDLALLPEVQFDAAILPDILARKAPDLEAPAPANVFIFPDLQSANIGYKIAERIGGVIATGPILQGLSRPVNDLSRGCSIDDIVRLIAITALQGQPPHP